MPWLHDEEVKQSAVAVVVVVSVVALISAVVAAMGRTLLLCRVSFHWFARSLNDLDSCVNCNQGNSFVDP